MAGQQEQPSYDLHRDAAAAYIKKHNLQALFSHLLQLLAYNKPADPRAFLRAEVKKMQSGGPGSGPTDLFSDDDLSTMFDMIDVTRQKKISRQQLLNACRNVAGNTGADVLTDAEVGRLLTKASPPVPADSQWVGQEAFQFVIGAQLRTQNHWKS